MTSASHVSRTPLKIMQTQEYKVPLKTIMSKSAVKAQALMAQQVLQFWRSLLNPL